MVRTGHSGSAGPGPRPVPPVGSAPVTDPPPPLPDGDVSGPAAEALAHAEDLCRFIEAAPSPYHAAHEVARRLGELGFEAVDETDGWPAGPGGRVLVRGGSVLAWWTDEHRSPASGFRIVGAHTDSPNLRIKPRPDTGVAGWRQLGVEVYGGALRNSWLDRDLGLSGRVTVRGPDGVEVRLVRDDRPLLRVPQLAIHLDRGVNEGLTLNPQQHMAPVWGTGPVDEGGFARHLAPLAGVSPADVLAWDVMAHDLTPPGPLGADRSLLASARLDNLLSCHAALSALARLLDAAPSGPAPVPVLCLFDHEEIGSESATGAGGNVLPTVLERIALGVGPAREEWFAALARSACISADGAHATHPNYPERHELSHHVLVNHGPVLKANANVRYATDAIGAGAVRTLAAEHRIPLQDFVVRSDMACGSTIGPVTSARLGITTVDVGVAQLSMHSARELCGAEDPEWFARLLTAFLGSGPEVLAR
jgi:aspartyl aminopeptidase